MGKSTGSANRTPLSMSAAERRARDVRDPGWDLLLRALGDKRSAVIIAAHALFNDLAGAPDGPAAREAIVGQCRRLEATVGQGRADDEAGLLAATHAVARSAAGVLHRLVARPPAEPLEGYTADERAVAEKNRILAVALERLEVRSVASAKMGFDAITELLSGFEEGGPPTANDLGLVRDSLDVRALLSARLACLAVGTGSLNNGNPWAQWAAQSAMRAAMAAFRSPEEPLALLGAMLLPYERVQLVAATS